MEKILVPSHEMSENCSLKCIMFVFNEIIGEFHLEKISRSSPSTNLKSSLINLQYFRNVPFFLHTIDKRIQLFIFNVTTHVSNICIRIENFS